MPSVFAATTITRGERDQNVIKRPLASDSQDEAGLANIFMWLVRGLVRNMMLWEVQFLHSVKLGYNIVKPLWYQQ